MAKIKRMNKKGEVAEYTEVEINKRNAVEQLLWAEVYFKKSLYFFNQLTVTHHVHEYNEFAKVVDEVTRELSVKIKSRRYRLSKLGKVDRENVWRHDEVTRRDPKTKSELVTSLQEGALCCSGFAKYSLLRAVPYLEILANDLGKEQYRELIDSINELYSRLDEFTRLGVRKERIEGEVV